MNKFLAVVKREYVQRVRSKFFVVMTILGPVMLMVFTVVPGFLLSKKFGDTRIAIVDQTEGTRLYSTLRDSLLRRDQEDQVASASRIEESANSNTKERFEKAGKSMPGSFFVEQATLDHRSLADVQAELNQRIGQNQLDGYLVIPVDILKNSKSTTSYYGRNVNDVFTKEQIGQRLNRAVSRQRLIDNGVPEQKINDLSKPVELAAYPINEKGEQGAQDSGAGFAMVFAIAFLIYITVLLYGQVVLGSVVDEKETRIAEILFSSVRSFTLMFGKLIGVSLVALTQMSIWVLAFGALSLWGLTMLQQRFGLDNLALPHLPPFFFIYFFLFFAVGYFVYATIYLLVGSMVTTTQEGGQVAMPIVFMLVAALYMSFPVIRSPNSPFAFWVSMVPFFSPITMMVRIVSQTPPLWQIALSLLIAIGTVALLLWLTARIYRVGMLMYGKKATIPEVMRWVKQA
jgi:ABC-2 type transport system permease protein